MFRTDINSFDELRGVLGQIKVRIEKLGSTDANAGASVIGVESGSGPNGADVQAVLEDLETRVAANEAVLADHETRITALEVFH